MEWDARLAERPPNRRCRNSDTYGESRRNTDVWGGSCGSKMNDLRIRISRKRRFGQFVRLALVAARYVNHSLESKRLVLPPVSKLQQAQGIRGHEQNPLMRTLKSIVVLVATAVIVGQSRDRAACSYRAERSATAAFVEFRGCTRVGAGLWELPLESH